jgi:hypothetical protein
MLCSPGRIEGLQVSHTHYRIFGVVPPPWTAAAFSHTHYRIFGVVPPPWTAAAFNEVLEVELVWYCHTHIL